MRTLWRVLGIVGLVVVLLLGGIALFAVHTVRASFPQTSGELSVPGLGAPVTVVRDDLGIPDIYADTVPDLFFAEGLRMDRDTRLAADEVREERFMFPVPPTATAWVELKLSYEHSPWGEDDNRVWLTFYTETEMVRRGS